MSEGCDWPTCLNIIRWTHALELEDQKELSRFGDGRIPKSN